ncbi:hypothetical protein QTP88_017954 [Uroleucon formosanum]
MNKRKRIKLECEKCDSQFDDNYKARPSKKKSTVSVPDVLSTSVSTTLSTQSSSLSFTYEMSPDNLDGSTIVEQLFITKSFPITESSSITVDKMTNEFLKVKVDEKFDIEKFAEIETSETIPDDELFSWMSCAEQVTAFYANFERASDILTNTKTVAVSNPRIFILFLTPDIVDKINIREIVNN